MLQQVLTRYPLLPLSLPGPTSSQLSFGSPCGCWAKPTAPPTPGTVGLLIPAGGTVHSQGRAVGRLAWMAWSPLKGASPRLASLCLSLPHRGPGRSGPHGSWQGLSSSELQQMLGQSTVA